MATNALGHQLAGSVGDEVTLGAYRRGLRLPWVPGATIDVWAPCARGEIATGVPQPHVYFVQTIGGTGAENGSIFCPDCRSERVALRAAVSSSPPPPRPQAPRVSAPPLPEQGGLPF